MFALSAIPVLLAAGAGIDYARYNTAQTHLQAALDAAALAGAAASGKSDTEREAIAQATFDANMTAGAAAGYRSPKRLRVDNGSLIAERRRRRADLVHEARRHLHISKSTAAPKWASATDEEGRDRPGARLLRFDE